MNGTIAERLERWRQRQFTHLAGFSPVTLSGRLLRINGMLLQCCLPQARIGELCRVQAGSNAWILAEVIACDQQDATLSALASLEGISAGAAVERLGAVHQVRVGNDLLGQVLDGFGRPLAGGDGGAFPGGLVRRPMQLYAKPPWPLRGRASVALCQQGYGPLTGC